MPYCCLTTNVAMSAQGTRDLAKKMSGFLGNQLGKPEKWVMLRLETAKTLLFGGSDCPAAYCELKSINLPEQKCSELSKAICAFLQEEARIEQDRIYIEFKDLNKAFFGWNGTTFAAS